MITIEEDLHSTDRESGVRKFFVCSCSVCCCIVCVHRHFEPNPAREDFKPDDRVSMDNFIIKCDFVSGIFLVSGVSDFSKMPSDIVSIAVSAGLGVSVLAGLLSGVCYILTQKIQKPKR